MTVKIIEAEYQITSTQFWEIKYIEDWPTDHEGQPRDLDTANDHWSSGDCCSCSGRVATTVEEYEPTAEENGHGRRLQVAGREYIDGELMA